MRHSPNDDLTFALLCGTVAQLCWRAGMRARAVFLFAGAALFAVGFLLKELGFVSY